MIPIIENNEESLNSKNHNNINNVNNVNNNANQEFLSRFSEFLSNKPIDYKNSINSIDSIDFHNFKNLNNVNHITNKTELSPNIIDEITPPANRYNLKNLPSNYQSYQHYSDYNYDGTPISLNRSEKFSTKENYTTVPYNKINQNTNGDKLNIDNQILLLSDSLQKLNTNQNYEENYFHNNYISSNNILNQYSNSLWSMSGSNQLPHPSLQPFNTQNKILSKFQQKSLNEYNNIDYCLNNIPISFQNTSKPSLSWIGKFPTKNYPDPLYSNKVFLGGLPWDITEQGLYTVFRQFGPCTFEWPGKDNRSTRHPPKGYVYLIFENERSVKNLLQYCYHDDQGTQFYFKLKTNTCSNEKSIQIIPWILANSSFLKCSSERLDITKTVFVGGLHGKITAENLALVFEELFGSVIYSGIDTDKNKYPIG